MPTNIQTIKNFPALIKYLRTDLGWPVDEEDAEKLTFEYDPEDLGLDEKTAVKVRSAKQLRPLVPGQPWGIFWIDFEPKKLPITIMRRILNQLVAKKRGGKSQQATWNLDDLLFISAVGDEKTSQREITFAHFHQEEGDLPTLRVLGWDGADTVLKIDYVSQMLKEKLHWPSKASDVENWRQQWASAFIHKPGHVIKTADALAERLAELARNIRAAAETIMEHESEKGRLRKLHKAFQTALIHDLSQEDFADTYAQTITYGLLTAAISRTDMTGGQHGTALVAENVTDMVPVTNPFLREMLETFLHVGGRQGDARQGGIDFDELGIQDVVELLRSDETDLPAILRDFNNRAEGEDPVIHFYQDFLNAYDRQLRIQRGVFYTPKPVVSYIVRGVHELLKTEFGLEDGLASIITWGEMVKLHPDIKIPKGVPPNSFFVMILDPATGTATFLVEVIDVIYKTMVAKWKKRGYKDAQIQAAWNEYVPTSLLPRLYGYELMMAPYAIAHMKIGLKLYETGYRFASDQRANIYLTNALEEPSQLAQDSAASLFEALGHESQAVNDVKRGVQFTVVVGNPPYSAISANLSPEFKKIVDIYRSVNGERIRERSMLQFEKNIQDDYVKFMAYSQARIKSSGIGIIALITNHSYLDGPTLRGVRWNLLSSFDKLWFFDLHGNANKKEIAPNNQLNENVFDIKQGVGMVFCVKRIGLNTNSQIWVSDLWGNREEKYAMLLRDSIPTTLFIAINPEPPYYYFFISENTPEINEYKTWLPVIEIFTKRSTGTETGFDDLLVGFSKSEVESKVSFFSNKKKSQKEIAEQFSISDGHAAELFLRRHEMEKIKDFEVGEFQLRAFDYRYALLRKNLLKTNSFNVMADLSDENPALVTTRQTKEEFTAFSARSFCGHKVTSSYDRSYIFPLFTVDETGLFSIKSPCIAKNVLAHFKNLMGKNTDETTLALNVFWYSLAILNSPTYKTLFNSEIKRDWPRIPLTKSKKLFMDLSNLGKKLMQFQFLEAPELLKNSIQFYGHNKTVESGFPIYQEKIVYINENSGFKGVPAEVWEFHIGGYQVCQKWLKDRRERELSAEDIVHYGKVVTALGETICLMGEVDAVIDVNGGWPVR